MIPVLFLLFQKHASLFAALGRCTDHSLFPVSPLQLSVVSTSPHNLRECAPDVVPPFYLELSSENTVPAIQPFLPPPTVMAEELEGNTRSSRLPASP